MHNPRAAECRERKLYIIVRESEKVGASAAAVFFGLAAKQFYLKV